MTPQQGRVTAYNMELDVWQNKAVLNDWTTQSALPGLLFSGQRYTGEKCYTFESTTRPPETSKDDPLPEATAHLKPSQPSATDLTARVHVAKYTHVWRVSGLLLVTLEEESSQHYFHAESGGTLQRSQSSKIGIHKILGVCEQIQYT